MKDSLKKSFKFSFIIFCIGLLLCILGAIFGGSLYDLNYNINFNNSKQIDQIYTDVKSLDINLGACQLFIKEGDNFRIVGSNLSNDVQSNVVDGTWTIKEFENRHILSFGDYKSKITLYIPKDFKSENLKIHIGAGRLSADSLMAKYSDISASAGSLEIDKLLTDNSKIDCRAGNVRVQYMLSDDITVNCGVGNVELNLIGDEKKYNYDFNVDVGEINFNNKVYDGLENKVMQNMGSNKKIKVNCDVGKVSINLKEV